MKKLLLAFDGAHFSKGAFDFARQLNDLRPVLLTGVFIPQLTNAYLWSYATGIAGTVQLPLFEKEDGETIIKNIEAFKELCNQNTIAFTVHKNFSELALPELRKETRFADLLIIDSEDFYKGIFGQDPDEVIKEVLHTSECPVIVIPKNFHFPAINILTYDGSASSVYAIKQFAYLFPELCSQETVLVYVADGKEAEIPSKGSIEELMHQHFMDVDFVKLDLNPKQYFSTWAEDNRNAILVSGSFGRSYLSELFRKSFLCDIIEENRIPVFITHK